eukprot:2468196-Pyramimonas_sp.AAC.3
MSPCPGQPYAAHALANPHCTDRYDRLAQASDCNSVPLPWSTLCGACIGQTPLRRSLRSFCSRFRLQFGARVWVSFARRALRSTTAAPISAFVLNFLPIAILAPLPWPSWRGACVGQFPLHRSLRSHCSNFRLRLGAFALVNLVRRMRRSTATVPTAAFVLLHIPIATRRPGIGQSCAAHALVNLH